MKRMIASLLMLAGSLHAQVLVNNFTETDGMFWRGNFNGISYSSASGQAGQIDVGFYTINDINPNGSLLGYNSGTGSGPWALPNGYTSGTGSDFNLSGVSGFQVSLRKESANTASLIYFSVVASDDYSYSKPIYLSSISESSFTDVYVPLSELIRSSNGSSLQPTLAAWTISIDAFGGGSGTYNLSVDSIRAVPEPSAVSLLAVGLAGLIALRRRKQA